MNGYDLHYVRAPQERQMRINTEESIRQAKVVHDKFGSWAKARKALAEDANGSSGETEPKKANGSGADARG